MATWTHDALQEDLAAHLRDRTQRLVWTNMQMGPSGSPRPDAYSLPFSFSRFTPIAYEVKISVADFRRDVTAGKWQSYLRYAAGVTFAAPAGLLTRTDLPEGCGLLLRSDAGWRVAKAPTLRPVDNLPLEAWIKLLIDGMAREAKRRFEEVQGEHHHIAVIRERLGNEVADLLQDRQRARHRYEQETKRLKGAADTAYDRYHELFNKAQEQAERDAVRVDRARCELALALGLPEDAPAHQIIIAAGTARRRLEADAEVERLQRLLDTVRKALTSAAEPLPAIARAA
ncbi:hypothetical protein ACI2VH_02820 [Ralstonia nicotianae]